MALPADNQHRAEGPCHFGLQNSWGFFWALLLVLLVNYGKITVLQNTVV